MTIDDIKRNARNRIAEIDAAIKRDGNNRALEDEREQLLTLTDGPRCGYCRKRGCATQTAMANANGPVAFNGVPCLMGSGSWNVSGARGT